MNRKHLEKRFAFEYSSNRISSRAIDFLPAAGEKERERGKKIKRHFYSAKFYPSPPVARDLVHYDNNNIADTPRSGKPRRVNLVDDDIARVHARRNLDLYLSAPGHSPRPIATSSPRGRKQERRNRRKIPEKDYTSRRYIFDRTTAVARGRRRMGGVMMKCQWRRTVHTRARVEAGGQY